MIQEGSGVTAQSGNTRRLVRRAKGLIIGLLTAEQSALIQSQTSGQQRRDDCRLCRNHTVHDHCEMCSIPIPVGFGLCEKDYYDHPEMQEKE